MFDWYIFEVLSLDGKTVVKRVFKEKGLRRFLFSELDRLKDGAENICISSFRGFSRKGNISTTLCNEWKVESLIEQAKSFYSE